MESRTFTQSKNQSKNVADDATFLFGNSPVASQMIIAQHDLLKNITKSLMQKGTNSPVPKQRHDAVPLEIQQMLMTVPTPMNTADL